MKKKNDVALIEPKMLPEIFSVRGQRVVFDFQLAELYGITVKQLNQAISRNSKRFPKDFCFQIKEEELMVLRSQIVSAKPQLAKSRTLPNVFTEHGSMMAANILRSPKAVQMSIFLVRAFVKMRDTIHANMTILKRLAELDKRFWEHDDMIHVLIAELRNMKNQLPADDAPPAKSKKIGFLADNS